MIADTFLVAIESQQSMRDQQLVDTEILRLLVRLSLIIMGKDMLFVTNWYFGLLSL